MRIKTELLNRFQNPGNEYRALPLAMKYNSMQDLKEKTLSGGWGGLHINYPHGGEKYLTGKDGWDELREIAEFCKEKGLNIWIYDEDGYPSGRASGHVIKDHPELQAQGLFYDSMDVAVSSGYQNIEWSLPAGKPYYVALCKLDLNGNITGEPVEYTGDVRSNTLSIRLQSGRWRLIAFVWNYLLKGTHAESTGGPYLNVLDPEAVRRFLEITYDAYYKHLGEYFAGVVKAIFNDEVSVISGYLSEEAQEYPAVAWYHGLPEIFEKRTGYNIKKCLPAIFNNTGPDTVKKRCDFYSMIAEQIGSSFFKQASDWCRRHNIPSTGHLLWEESLIYHANFYGNVFPSLREIDWPGIDVLECEYACLSGSHTEGGPVTPKLASSASHLWGRERTMSESFWNVTGNRPVEDLMAHYGWQAVLGINTLTTITVQEYYPAEKLKLFNDYVSRLNLMLTQGAFTADIAVLYPITSVLAEFRPTNRHVHYVSDNPKAKDVDDAWRQVTAEILSCQRDFDYIDESVICQADVSRGKIKFGNCSYSILILPHVTTLNNSTLDKIKQFVDNGGTVISYRTIPYDPVETDAAGTYHETVEELWGRKDRVIHTETLKEMGKALAAAGTPDLMVTPPSRDIYYQHRILEEGHLFFVINNSKEAVSRDFCFNTAGEAEVWDPLSGKAEKADAVSSGGGSRISLTIPGRSGRFILFHKY